MDNTYYLPIESVNIAHYFSKGIISPSKYYSNRNPDIQNKFDNGILLSNNIYTKDTDCSLEIVLDDKEDRALKKISDIFFIYNKPLPISRVKSIIFENEDKSKSVLFDINTGDAFIPKTLVKIIEPKNIKISIPEKFDLPIEEIDFTEKLDKFNRIMGGFALMRLGGEGDMNYSKNYFKPLSFINKRIKQQVEKAPFSFNESYTGFIDNLADKNNFYKYFYSDISFEDVEKQAQKDNIILPKKMGVISFDQIDESKKTYFFSILETYGNDKRKSLDDFFSSLITNKFDSKKEGISLIFGINKGYKAFRNFYTIGDKKIIIKFQLNSQLDYYTIESVYQFVFNDITDNYNFPYIDRWCSKYEDNINYNGFDTYKILDKTIIYGKKAVIGSKEYLQELFKKYSLENLYRIISDSILNWFPPFFKKDDLKKETNDYFKNKLESELENFTKNILTKVKKDLESDFESDKKELQSKIVHLENKLKSSKNEFSHLQKKHKELIFEHDTLIKNSEKEFNTDKKLEKLDSVREKRSENPVEKTEQSENQENEEKDKVNPRDPKEYIANNKLDKTASTEKDSDSRIKLKKSNSDEYMNDPEFNFEEDEHKSYRAAKESKQSIKNIPLKGLQESREERFNELKSRKFKKEELFQICNQKNIAYKKGYSKDYLAKLISDFEFKNQ